MTPTKILIGQIAVVFAIVIGGLWAATQWAAAMLGYQARLGAPWIELFGWPVYLPWRLFEWWYAFDAYAPWVFEKAGALAASGGLVGSLVAVIGSLWRARQTRLVTTYGSSRWATRAEVEQAGLFKPAGVFLGRLGGHYLRHDGPEHVMAFAPTRCPRRRQYIRCERLWDERLGQWVRGGPYPSAQVVSSQRNSPGSWSPPRLPRMSATPIACKVVVLCSSG